MKGQKYQKTTLKEPANEVKLLRLGEGNEKARKIT